MSLTKNQKALLPSYNIIHTPKHFTAKKIGKSTSEIISKPIKAPFAFDSLVLSASARLDKKASLLLCAAVKTKDGWSPFYKMAQISRAGKNTFANVNDAYASTDIDILLPKKPTEVFKYKIIISGAAASAQSAAKVDLICAALTRAGAKYDANLALETLDLRDFEIKVPALSQHAAAQKSLRNRLCSPAVICMLLNYYGKAAALEETAKEVFDGYKKIYGVWPLNSAQLAQRGLLAVTMRCCSLAQAEGELLKARPLAASISYKAGELKNAPLKKTQGHFVLMSGFDKKGNVIALDPAAKTKESVRRVYDRKQFARAWLKNKKGLCYAAEDIK